MTLYFRIIGIDIRNKLNEGIFVQQVRTPPAALSGYSFPMPATAAPLLIAIRADVNSPPSLQSSSSCEEMLCYRRE